jgi:hypothetical protein
MVQGFPPMVQGFPRFSLCSIGPAHGTPPLSTAAGQCLSRDNLAQLIQFAHEEGIVLMADEVYQENIYQDERPFISARKVGRGRRGGRPAGAGCVCMRVFVGRAGGGGLPCCGCTPT